MYRVLLCGGLVCLLAVLPVAGAELRPGGSDFLRRIPLGNPPFGQLQDEGSPWEGVRIQRWRRDTPPVDWTLCWIDLATPGLGYQVSAVHYQNGPGGFPVQAVYPQTTVDFLREHSEPPRVDLAVNTVAYYFVPAYPGKPVFLSDPVWQGEDRKVGPGPGTPMLGLSPGWALIGPPDEIRAAGPLHAFAGFPDRGKCRDGVAVRDGQAQSFTLANPHGRTLAGVTKDERVLILLTADGYNPGVSEGLSLTDAAEVLRTAGAHQGIFLDGGGSSLLVGRGDAGPELFNRPAGLLNTPGTLRYIAVSLGFTNLRRTGERLPALANWKASAPVVLVCEVVTWGEAYPWRSVPLLAGLAVVVAVLIASWLRNRRRRTEKAVAGP
jgi:hypothetical protein